jgi:hypothetical protein
MESRQRPDLNFRIPPHTVLEAKVDDDLKRVGSSHLRPQFTLDSHIIIERLCLYARPEFLLKPTPINEWLKNKTLVVTTIQATDRCSSTASWICLFKDCGNIYSIMDELVVMEDARFVIP